MAGIEITRWLNSIGYPDIAAGGADDLSSGSWAFTAVTGCAKTVTIGKSGVLVIVGHGIALASAGATNARLCYTRDAGSTHQYLAVHEFTAINLIATLMGINVVTGLTPGTSVTVTLEAYAAGSAFDLRGSTSGLGPSKLIVWTP